jgi:hypothetical protein
MRIRALPCSFLLVPLLSACSPSLGLDIMNAGDRDIEVAIESDSQRVGSASQRARSEPQRVIPGLSFHGTYLGREHHAEIMVTDGSCHYRYAVPDLALEPWGSLIGASVKFRWFSDGRMVAYPPTPYVQIAYNPQRASTDEATRTIQPVEFGESGVTAVDRMSGASSSEPAAVCHRHERAMT